MPIKMIITSGTVNDRTVGAILIKDLSAEHLLADKGYDTDGIITAARATDMKPVIPPKINRKKQRY
jgi:transposase